MIFNYKKENGPSYSYDINNALELQKMSWFYLPPGHFENLELNMVVRIGGTKYIIKELNISHQKCRVERLINN